VLESQDLDCKETFVIIKMFISFISFPVVKNVTCIILVMQNRSKWQKVNSSCQDYQRVIVAASWHIKTEGFYLIIVHVEELRSKYQMQNKCHAKGMQEVYFFALWVCCSRILSLSIATTDVSSPPSLIMYF